MSIHGLSGLAPTRASQYCHSDTLGKAEEGLCIGCPGGFLGVLRALAVLWGKGVTWAVCSCTEPLQGLRAREGCGGLRAQGQWVLTPCPELRPQLLGTAGLWNTWRLSERAEADAERTRALAQGNT